MDELAINRGSDVSPTRKKDSKLKFVNSEGAELLLKRRRNLGVGANRKILRGLVGQKSMFDDSGPDVDEKEEVFVEVEEVVRSVGELMEDVFGEIEGDDEKRGAIMALLDFMKNGVIKLGALESDKDEAIWEAYQTCLVPRARELLGASLQDVVMNADAFELGVEIVMSMRDEQEKEGLLLDIKDELLIDKHRFRRLSQGLVTDVVLNLAQIDSESASRGVDELISEYFDPHKLYEPDWAMFGADEVARLYTEFSVSEDSRESGMGQQLMISLLEYAGVTNPRGMIEDWKRVGRKSRWKKHSGLNEVDNNVYKNLKDAIKIERGCAGAVAHCASEYGIRNFERMDFRYYMDVTHEDRVAAADFSELGESISYTLTDLAELGILEVSEDYFSSFLQKMADKVGLEVDHGRLTKDQLLQIGEIYKRRRMGVFIYAMGDSNSGLSGENYTGWRVHGDLRTNPQYGMRLVEARDQDEFLGYQKKIVERFGKIVFGFLGAHGAQIGFDLGDQVVSVVELLGKNGQMWGDLYEKGANFLFDSCSTGRAFFSFARAAARKFGITIYAPDNDVSDMSTDFVVPEDGSKPRFENVEYWTKGKQVKTRRLGRFESN